MYAVLGIVGGLLSLLSNVPYIIDTIKGRTKPHRVTWGIFFLLNCIFIANQLAAGATNSIWLVVAFAVSTGMVFALSFKKGTGGKDVLDLVVLVGALFGVVLWQVLDSPVASIVANLIVAAIASIPTYKKAWLYPQSETAVSYSLGAFAAILSVISVGKIDVALLLLPVYSIIYQGSIYFILIRKRILSNGNNSTPPVGSI